MRRVPTGNRLGGGQRIFSPSSPLHSQVFGSTQNSQKLRKSKNKNQFSSEALSSQKSVTSKRNILSTPCSTHNKPAQTKNLVVESTKNANNRVKSPRKNTGVRLSCEQLLLQCIDNILDDKEQATSFVFAFSAAHSIREKNVFDSLVSSMREKLIAKAESLSENASSSTSSLLNEYKAFMKNVDKIQSFMQFVFLNNPPAKNERRNVPSHKFKAEIEQRKNKTHEIGLNVWKEHVFVKAVKLLSSSIKKMFQDCVTGKSKIDENVKEMYKMFLELGEDYIVQVASLFNCMFVSKFSSMKTKDKIEVGKEKLTYLMSELERLKDVFTFGEMLERMFRPHMKDAIMPLLESRENEVLPKVKDFLLQGSTAPNIHVMNEYTSLVVSYMEGCDLPIDFFSLSSFFVYFSSLLTNDHRVRQFVGSYVNRTTTNFPSLICSVIFSHINISDNIKSLACLVPLYTNQELISIEFSKQLMVRLLQNRTNANDNERKLVSLLKRNSILARATIRQAELILDDFVVTGNYIMACSSLWNPLIMADCSPFPDDIANEANTGLAKFNTQYKTFSLSATFSVAYVTAKYTKKVEDVVVTEEKYFTMSVLQYKLLRMIERCETNLMKANASEDAIRTAISGMLKAKLIAKVPGGTFCISKEGIKTSKKKINIYDSAIVIKHKKRDEARDDLNNQNAVKSAIVRIMKCEDTMNELDLIFAVKREASKYFEVDDNDVKRGIKSLINEEFISRMAEDNSVIVYVP